MLRNRAFITVIFLLLAGVIGYNIYYFTMKPKPIASGDMGQLATAIRAPVTKGRSPADAPRQKPTGKRGESPVHEPQTTMDLAEILNKIHARDVVTAPPVFGMNPFRSLPDDPSMEGVTEAEDRQETISDFEAKSYSLTAIITSSGHRSAIINGRFVNEGEELDGARIKRIAGDEVEMEQAGMTRIIPLAAQQAQL